MNAPQNSKQIKEKLEAVYNQFRPTLALYRQYAESVVALSIEYHKGRLNEVFPHATNEELSLAATLDMRDSPASLDQKLAQLASELHLKKIITDLVAFKIYLFV